MRGVASPPDPTSDPTPVPTAVTAARESRSDAARDVGDRRFRRAGERRRRRSLGDPADARTHGRPRNPDLRTGPQTETTAAVFRRVYSVSGSVACRLFRLKDTAV
jgi:hypothetical protein